MLAFPPGQMYTSALAVTVNGGETVTVTASTAVHPLASVTVTL